MADEYVPLRLPHKDVEPPFARAPHLHPIVQTHRQTRSQRRKPAAVAAEEVLGTHDGSAGAVLAGVRRQGNVQPDRVGFLCIERVKRRGCKGDPGRQPPGTRTAREKGTTPR